MFLERYNKASEEVRTLIDSDKIPRLSREILNGGEESNKEAAVLTIAISNYILGVITQEELLKVTNFTEEDSVSLIKKIELLQENLLEKPSTSQQPTTIAEPRPLTREELMQKLTPRRTMVADVASVQHQKEAAPQAAPSRGYDEYTKNGGGV